MVAKKTAESNPASARSTGPSAGDAAGEEPPGADESAAGKPAAKKAAAGKAAAKKAPSKRAPAKEAATKKPAAKKASARKTAAAHKAPARKAPAHRAPATKAAAAAQGAAQAAEQTEVRTVVAKKTARGSAAGKRSTAGIAAAVPPGELPVRPGEDPWTPEEVAEARAGLQSEDLRLGSEIAAAEAALAGLMRDSGDGAGDDQADTGTKNITRESELALAANAREMLEQTERALERLDAGTYGLCENCGNPIGKARMQAFPRATLCVECKQKQERRY
ncbi:TraR/DksA family transcriptional regulator [Streptomyces sp. NBC_00344]|uniref:TraR/DksA family transcriptional regulator n=1 Tax=Streptomyces sp. NBC_00344 TaxID=2975720 RepID=UPI002E211C00